MDAISYASLTSIRPAFSVPILSLQWHGTNIHSAFFGKWSSLNRLIKMSTHSEILYDVSTITLSLLKLSSVGSNVMTGD